MRIAGFNLVKHQLCHSVAVRGRAEALIALGNTQNQLAQQRIYLDKAALIGQRFLDVWKHEQITQCNMSGRKKIVFNPSGYPYGALRGREPRRYGKSAGRGKSGSVRVDMGGRRKS